MLPIGTIFTSERSSGLSQRNRTGCARVWVEISLGTIAITLAVAIFMASTQCVAACGVLPCDDLSERNQPDPSEDCHHKAPPADNHHDKTTCGHQFFVSDVGPQDSAVTFTDVVFAVIAIKVVESIPETLVLLDPDLDHSPPPPSDLFARTILRV